MSEYLPKYANVPKYILGSENIRFAARLSRRFMTASPVSELRRAISSARSSSLRKEAVSGQSTTQNLVMKPKATVTMPSMMKIQRQPP